ncbi:hypothetical protein Tco_1522421 [Tanacetum coccineum]
MNMKLLYNILCRSLHDIDTYKTGFLCLNSGGISDYIRAVKHCLPRPLRLRNRMSTLVFIDPKISSQADGAQSSRVPVPLPEDPYEAIRQAYLVGMDTESEPFEDPIETEAPESPTLSLNYSEAIDHLKNQSTCQMFRAAQIQVPRYDLYDLHWTLEENGEFETLDPQFLLGPELLEIVDSIILGALLKITRFVSLGLH